MRAATTLLLLAAAAATSVPIGSSPARASCVAPSIGGGAPPVLRPGATTRVTGTGFVGDCRDTGTCSASPGCSSCDRVEPPRPLRDVDLVLRQGRRSWSLATTDARGGSRGPGSVTWTVWVPAEVHPGWATLVPEGGEPLRVRVR